MQKKVSIIIPVYGVEKYLEKCLSSVCIQSYKNLEIIVIDDESQDNSGQIADSFVQRDARVQVLHIKNRGAAGARNVGLNVSSGEYIMFVDSDDWIEENMVERLVDYLEEQSCDIVQCQFFDEYLDSNEKHFFINENRFYTNLEFLEDMIYTWEDILIWNKLVKRKCIENVRFVEGRCIDDEFFTYKMILKADKIMTCTDSLYHYRMRKSGAMATPNYRKQRLLDQVDFVTERFRVVCKCYPILERKYLRHMCETYMRVMQKAECYDDIYQYAKKHLRKYGRMLLRKDVPTTLKKSICMYLLKRNIRKSCTPIENDLKNYFE